MVIAVRAHCNPLDIYIYIYFFFKSQTGSSRVPFRYHLMCVCEKLRMVLDLISIDFPLYIKINLSAFVYRLFIVIV